MSAILENIPLSEALNVNFGTEKGAPKKKVTPKTTAKPGHKGILTKKATNTAAPGNHPTYNEMICQAISAHNDRNGSSRQAIVKYVMDKYDVGSDKKNISLRIKTSLKKMSALGKIKQAKGTGASGSFKIGESVSSKKTLTNKTGLTKSTKKQLNTVSSKAAIVEDHVKTKSLKSKTAKPTSIGRIKKSKPIATKKPSAKKAFSPSKSKVDRPKKRALSSKKKVVKKLTTSPVKQSSIPAPTKLSNNATKGSKAKKLVSKSKKSSSPLKRPVVKKSKSSKRSAIA